MDNPVVTVICITYNHAPYIRDALEGFVGQQTDFPVEIIVHDDASTDGTADVVREYAARYPDRVRPVIQTENQYSRGVAILPVYCFPLVRGRYVALCEGDDHWTDPTKLQRQVEALEHHPEMDFCAHCTRRTRDGRTIGFVAPRLKDGVIPAEEVVKVIPLATASLLIRKTCYLTLTPMREIRFNDMALQLQALARGGVMYLSRCMAEYRSQTPGSWTAAHRGKMALEDRRVDRMQLEAFDAWTDGKFHGAVRWRLAKIETGNIISCHRYWELFAPRWILWTFRRLGYTLRRRFNSLVCRLRWKTG